MAQRHLDPVFIRPSTRRRKRRRLPRAGRWLPRVGRWLRPLGLWGAVTAGLCALVVSMADPVSTRLRQREELAATKARAHRLRQEKAALQETLRLLKTDSGKEIEIRKLGWIREGEIPIIVHRAPNR